MSSIAPARTPRRGRRARDLITGLAVAGAVVAGVAAPADAISLARPDALVFVPYKGQTTTVWRDGDVVQPVHFSAAQVVTGDFSAADGTDVLLYNPGAGADGILHVTPLDGAPTTSFRSEKVSGTFRPVVGDYNADGIDDVLWYAPGPASDHLWTFAADGSHTSAAIAINGTYRPTVADIDHDGGDDVIWYGPGTAADALWRFDDDGSHESLPVTIGGDYQLVVGRFGSTERVLFFNAHGPDSVWTFDSGAGHTSSNLPAIEGAARPIVGSFTHAGIDQVLFYRPGGAAETFVGFTPDGTPQQLEAPNVNGSYDPAVGDFDDDGWDDIAWASQGKAVLWEFNGGGYDQRMVTTNTVNTIAVTAFDDRGDID